MSNGRGRSEQEQTLVDNEVYNVITALFSTLERIAADKKYERDAGSSGGLWGDMR